MCGKTQGSSISWLSNLIYKLFLSYLDSHALLVGLSKIYALNYISSFKFPNKEMTFLFRIFAIKTDLSYIHFNFQVAHLMDSKPIEVLMDANVQLLQTQIKSLGSNLVVVIVKLNGCEQANSQFDKM